MKSRKYTHIALAALTTTVLTTACTFEQEDYFDESASLRVEHVNNDLQKRLVEQSDTAQGKHGWVIQYFVAGTDDYSFEGFNLFGRFTNKGGVTLASNHRYLRGGNANKYTEHSSTYNMLAEEGPVLSFDTWNDILTVFEDPVDPSQAPGSLIQNGEGMYGDHNLVFLSQNENEILFRGERHAAKVRFLPCDRPWQQYIEETQKLKAYITNNNISSYYVVSGTDTLYFLNLARGRFTYAERVNDPLITSSVACCFTPKGFSLENRNNINGTSFKDFRMAADSTCLVSENDSVKVIACWDNYAVAHTSIWNLDNDKLTAEQQSLWQQIDSLLKLTSANYELINIGWGRTTGGNAVKGLVFTFYNNKAHTKTNTMGVELNVQRTAFGQFSITCDASCKADANVKSYDGRNSPGIEAAVRQFAATVTGTYNMTPNNHFLPTGGTLTAVDGSRTLVFK